MFTVKIDDSQVLDFTRKSPRRAEWAMAEALKAAGGHLRKEIIEQIDAAAGWPGLSPETLERKRKYGGRGARARGKPLQIFKRLVRFRYSKSRKYKTQRVRVGIFNIKGWFKKYYGVGAAVIARLHEIGRTSPKYGKRPARPMIEPVWQRERQNITRYVEKKFFRVFFSKRRPGLKM